MLFCETTGDGLASFEDLAVFANQLAGLGVAARVAVGSMPERPGSGLQFDLAPRLVDAALRPGDSLALLAADRLTDDALLRLRRLADGAEITVRAFGCFARMQTTLGIRARLSYVFGREPELFDTSPQDPALHRPGPVFGVPRRGQRPWFPVAEAPRILVVGPDLKDPVQAAALLALAPHRRFRLTVVTSSQGKQEWIAANGRGIPFFHYGEVPPLDLAARADIGLFLTGTQGSYRLQMLAANLLLAGVPLLDGSPGQRLAKDSDGFIEGPGLLGLDGFLHGEILPNLGAISAHVRASRAAAEVSPEPVLARLGEAGDPPARRRPAARPAPADIVFLPTNGVGLGHAQRCTLIAGALGPRRAHLAFAAYPSCMSLIKSRGFDVMPLIGRSPIHAQSHEHDLANYLRLRALTAGARTLVFDGGYVFESVYRTVMAGEVAGVWIRRGLWQDSQDNSVALDREKAFARVIVPSEAFDELNRPYSRGEHVHPVGPIVQEVYLPAAVGRLREGLAERYGRSFDRLAISLLGGGVAADRGAQVQALCGLFERRTDTLHLVVAWPGATLEPGWFGWRNSRVVRTHYAAVLAAVADVAVTAAGYNSFHEMLYNRVPAIFVPQTGPFMDDQSARARAACDRGLATMAAPHELMKLERLMVQYLDDGEAGALRARLAAAELPETGTARTASLIEELTHGSDEMERDDRADLSAGLR
ncbi:MAG: glycosyltransferase [Amaricoccus sp.]